MYVTKLNTRSKFCSLQCHRDFVWENEKKPSLLAGGKGSRNTYKRLQVDLHGNKCRICEIDNEWNGKPLSLHLDHIDGNSDNDSIENHRLLCPNCHTQTPTYGSKGFGNTVKKETKRNMYLRKYKGYVSFV